MTFGKTQKGGAASIMQPATSKNVNPDLVEKKATDKNDDSAILSAEAHATRMSCSIKGGVGSVAQSTAELNQRVVNPHEKTQAYVLTCCWIFGDEVEMVVLETLPPSLERS
ncbi:hypothetical protein R1flu_017724 [Riccia fluitans]|uniref:SMP domain-containing protein n=1 Tax=Riccia fluitans TaxID=41844 RepID=A0ABD1ZG48_9MARC